MLHVSECGEVGHEADRGPAGVSLTLKIGGVMVEFASTLTFT